MRTLIHCFKDYRALWRAWLPLLFVTLLSAPLALALPLLEKQLIDGVLLPLRLDLLPQIVGLYAGFWLLSRSAFSVSANLKTYLTERLSMRLSQRLFDHCEALSLAFSHRAHSGRTTALFLNDVPSLARLFSTTTFNALESLLLLLFAAALSFSLSWQLALVVGLAPPLVMGCATLLTRPLRPAARRAQDKAAELSERLQENLAGLREVVAFTQERAEGIRFASTLGELLRLRMRVSFIDTGIQVSQSLFAVTVMLAIVGYGGALFIQGEISLGTLVAMRAIFDRLFYPAVQLIASVGSWQKALGAADRVYAFLDETPRVQEHRLARTPNSVAGLVTFDRVSFAYQLGQPVLRDVSFAAKPGGVIALVGPSGAGKSTLASLIARFYDPTGGRVLLDGVDLRDLTLAGLRSQIGIVFQDTFLFSATVRENIAFGREGAEDAQIIAAARAANAWEFIERLPDGLDTYVGERGVQLSEGQKQRVAIARALLRDPRILILDEPTSALDARSEHLLQTALENLMRGRTTFVIAHRLATVQRADRILVLDAGRIVEQGPHAELLQRDGLYREFYELQFGGLSRSDNGALRTHAKALTI